MRRIRACVVVIALFAASAGLGAAPASDKGDGSGGLALGIFLGQPTGLSLRYGLGKGHSLEAKAAWSFESPGKEASASFQANWLIEFPGVLVVEKEDFPLYTGVGLQTDLGTSPSLGFRIPLGLEYRFAKAPLELCLEIGLGLQLFPSTSFLSSGGFGARYRFQAAD